MNDQVARPGFPLELLSSVALSIKAFLDGRISYTRRLRLQEHNTSLASATKYTGDGI